LIRDLPKQIAYNLGRGVLYFIARETDMKQGQLAPESVTRAYMAVLCEAILNERMRIRYGESIDLGELHDLLDGIHNIPEMLCAYGGWHVETNINWDMGRYDERWYRPDATSESLRSSLLKALEREKELLKSLPELPPGP
jgi:hypothetical protein